MAAPNRSDKLSIRFRPHEREVVREASELELETESEFARRAILERAREAVSERAPAHA